MSGKACGGKTYLFFSPHTCWGSCPPDCQAGRSESGRFERIKTARALCASCPVQPQCLEWAIETRFPYGFIGGRSERQRKLIIQEREKAARRKRAGRRPVASPVSS